MTSLISTYIYKDKKISQLPTFLVLKYIWKVWANSTQSTNKQDRDMACENILILLYLLLVLQINQMMFFLTSSGLSMAFFLLLTVWYSEFRDLNEHTALLFFCEYLNMLHDISHKSYLYFHRENFVLQRIQERLLAKNMNQTGVYPFIWSSKVILSVVKDFDNYWTDGVNFWEKKFGMVLSYFRPFPTLQTLEN